MLEGPPSEDPGRTAFSEGDESEFEGTVAATAASRLPPSILGDDGYRDVLRGMVSNGGRCSLSVLNRTLVAEADWPPSTGICENPYQVTHIALVREYIPVLTQFDALRYDTESGTLALVRA